MGVDFKWRSEGTEIAHVRPEPPWRSRRLRRCLLLVGLALLVAGGTVACLAQRASQAARAELERHVGQEILALQSGQRELFLALLDDLHAPWLRYHQESFERESAWYAARASARPTVKGIKLRGDRSAVGIVLCDGTQSWSATWFYQRVGGQWRHIPPPPEYWGQAISVTTPHVYITAQGPDRHAAGGLASALEALYVDMAAIYGLHTEPGEDVRPNGEPPAGRVVVRSFPYGACAMGTDSFPSPQLALEMWTAEERQALLVRNGRLAVARAALRRALGQSQPRVGDWWLLEGLALWHAGAWQPEWRAHIQASLADGTFKRLFDVQGYGRGPSVLAWDAHTLPADPEWAGPLAYTLAEFLGANYTSRQLSAVVRAIEPSGSAWAALQATLGLSRADLEAAWAAYLGDRYS